FIGEFYPHSKMAIQLPSNVTEYTLEWDGTDFAVFADAEQVGTPIFEAWLSSGFIFHAASYDPGPRLSDAYQPNAPKYNGTDITISDVPLAAPTVAAIPFLNSSHSSQQGYTAAGNMRGLTIPANMSAASAPVSKYDPAITTLYAGNSRAGFRTYHASTNGVVSATFATARSLAELELTGTDRTLRLRYLDITFLASSGTGYLNLTLQRMTTGSTGGSTITPNQSAVNSVWNASASSYTFRQTATGLGGTSAVLHADVYPVGGYQKIVIVDDDLPDGVMPIELSQQSGFECLALIGTPSAGSITPQFVVNAVWTEV
ncbi:MAG: hypothetical protein KDK27_10410, partial [Leptospiraceae bacterium]|nr:hypothetical protein [Leptospiraceae bacterium]